MTEDEMVGWHHRLNGHEFEQASGDGEGQGSLVRCSPWGHKESDTTEQLNNNKWKTYSSHYNHWWKAENSFSKIRSKSTAQSLVTFIQHFIGICSLVTKLYLTLCNPVDCRAPGFPILHYLLEFVQTHVHQAGDSMQPIHPLLPPSPPALTLSQHQGLLQLVGSSH